MSGAPYKGYQGGGEMGAFRAAGYKPEKEALPHKTEGQTPGRPQSKSHGKNPAIQMHIGGGHSIKMWREGGKTKLDFGTGVKEYDSPQEAMLKGAEEFKAATGREIKPHQQEALHQKHGALAPVAGENPLVALKKAKEAPKEEAPESSKPAGGKAAESSSGPHPTVEKAKKASVEAHDASKAARHAGGDQAGAKHKEAAAKHAAAHEAAMAAHEATGKPGWKSTAEEHARLSSVHGGSKLAQGKASARGAPSADDLSVDAHEASKIAKDSGKPEHHDEAAQAHDKASRAQKESGNADKAREHGKLANQHLAATEKAPPKKVFEEADDEKRGAVARNHAKGKAVIGIGASEPTREDGMERLAKLQKEMGVGAKEPTEQDLHGKLSDAHNELSGAHHYKSMTSGDPAEQRSHGEAAAHHDEQSFAHLDLARLKGDNPKKGDPEHHDESQEEHAAKAAEHRQKAASHVGTTLGRAHLRVAQAHEDMQTHHVAQQHGVPHETAKKAIQEAKGSHSGADKGKQGHMSVQKGKRGGMFITTQNGYKIYIGKKHG